MQENSASESFLPWVLDIPNPHPGTSASIITYSHFNFKKERITDTIFTGYAIYETDNASPPSLTKLKFLPKGYTFSPSMIFLSEEKDKYITSEVQIYKNLSKLSHEFPTAELRLVSERLTYSKIIWIMDSEKGDLFVPFLGCSKPKDIHIVNILSEKELLSFFEKVEEDKRWKPRT